MISPVEPAEHYIARNARLIDRYRFAYLFQNGPAEPVRAALDTYRNVDGGYGNALEPDLRGHASQPLAAATALSVLDELGPLPRDVLPGLLRYLTSVSRPDGGLPPVLPGVRHSDAAPWWRELTDHSSALDPTAFIVALLHKHHAPSRWRDHATAFCWTRIAALRWIRPEQAVAVCTFLEHVSDRERAQTELRRLAPMLLRTVTMTPGTFRGPTPLDLAPTPRHIIRPLFADTLIRAHLDALQAAQALDGGWPAEHIAWCPGAHAAQRDLATLRALTALRDNGRLGGSTPVRQRTPADA
ncbi:hypothetical protein Nans01_02640 [Nocardiopsis ansamitocini]|uniref:Uncharacterized protein n=2 Tax=Nocardiopsis ansamitocini TaxID=1670832 RepID=A0A9W6P2F3_9ACTN|nr:hypothetical protein Nans01_02640 [Nocardiopsis ansamitocini]